MISYAGILEARSSTASRLRDTDSASSRSARRLIDGLADVVGNDSRLHNERSRVGGLSQDPARQ